MKVFNHGIDTIQIQIRRGNEKVLYITFYETTLEETTIFLKRILPTSRNKNDLYVTRLSIRERSKGTYGRYAGLTFYGLSCIKTKELILKEVEKLNSIDF